MNRNLKDVYCFIYDDNKQFYRARQMPDGSWSITSSGQMYPLTHPPRNLHDSPVEFATNKQYLSMNRTINYPLEFTFDGAAILNYKYLNGKGLNEILYFSIFQFDSATGKFVLTYNGRFDFHQKKRDEKIATFTVPIVDDSAWGILSQNEDVEYEIDCSVTNPKAIRVLFDNFTLQNRYTFQTVQAPITRAVAFDNTFTIPFVMINQDGDSFGIVTKDQIIDMTDTVPLLGMGTGTPPPPDADEYTTISPNFFFYTYYPITGVNFQGRFTFEWTTLTMPSGTCVIFFRSSTGQHHEIFKQNNLVAGKTYTVDFNFNMDFVSGEKLFFYAQLNDNAARNFTITPITTNIFVSLITKAPATVCYGLRPLDLLKEIVEKATLHRYTINSDFFTVNNKTVLIPGDSLRGIPNSKIYTTFKDFFDSFNYLFFMALKNVNGNIFMELADEVYKPNGNIIDLGEIIECSTEPAVEYYPNQIIVGSPKQDYRHANGRLEFNCEFKWALPFVNIKNEFNWVSKYRTDSFGMIFLIIDYQGGSTQDNSGDKSVFIVDITDEQGSATDLVETFENINVNNAPLAPIIKFPLSGDVINNNKPVLRGVGIPGSTVNIYRESTLDGTTTVDSNGNWTYQIVTALPSYAAGVFDGISNISATNTTMSGALNTIQLIIDTTVAAPLEITYPRPSDNLYNNLPLVKGTAPPLTNINISLDGVFVAAIVADNSCRWEYKFTTPIPNGIHILDIGGGISIGFTVNSFTEFPLITYIGSELDGFPIVNNLPLIKGVGKPGTLVSIWLNYLPYSALGTAVVDANGDWSFQVIPINYNDPITGIPLVLAPIRNGLSVVSTSLINQNVPIAISGFKLNRPAYDSITGVPDNTVFNTRLSPKRMMLNHKSMLSAIMDKQHGDLITFQKADKNSNLRTVLGSEVVTEREDIETGQLGDPFSRLEIARVKCVARKSYAQTLYDFNNGGTVRATFKGNELLMMPIGSMAMKNILDDTQEWSLLVSPKTSYQTLLNLYRTGLTINLMTNAIFHSDYNALHFVQYNLADNPKYNFKELYDDWFCNRNSAWLYNPEYTQKYQRSEVITDQVITNGIVSLSLRVYRCSDAVLIDVIPYATVSPAPIPGPEIVLEAKVDFNDYPEGEYFFVIASGSLLTAISEKVSTRDKWKRTILIESNNSTNMPGVFFSTGFKTILRVEGLVKKLQPVISTVVADEESGDSKLLWSNIARHRMIRYGTARGLPDYLAMKVANALSNDGCMVEGVYYTLEQEEKLNPSDDTEGIPLYYYNVNMKMQENQRGKVFAGQEDSDLGGVILVVDATAIGLPPDVLINIDEH